MLLVLDHVLLGLAHVLIIHLVEPGFVPEGLLPSVRARILLLLLARRQGLRLHDLQRETLGHELLRAIADVRGHHLIHRNLAVLRAPLRLELPVQLRFPSQLAEGLGKETAHACVELCCKMIEESSAASDTAVLGNDPHVDNFHDRHRIGPRENIELRVLGVANCGEKTISGQYQSAQRTILDERGAEWTALEPWRTRLLLHGRDQCGRRWRLIPCKKIMMPGRVGGARLHEAVDGLRPLDVATSHEDALLECFEAEVGHPAHRDDPMGSNL